MNLGFPEGEEEENLGKCETKGGGRKTTNNFPKVCELKRCAIFYLYLCSGIYVSEDLFVSLFHT